MKKSSLCALFMACAASLTLPTAWAAEQQTEQTEPAETAETAASGYIARNEGLRGFFDALAAQLKKPVVLSKLAARKQISGEFDLRDAQAMLDKLSQQMGLIWYHDGQAVYVYDASEIRNSVISLRNISLSTFNDFLRRSGLYDKRYPLHGDERSGTFYVSGPPIYVDMVVNAATFMDKQSGGADMGRQKIGVVRLNNTFVNDRSYQMRDQKITIPGMATVIERLLQGEGKPLLRTMGTVASTPPPVADQARANIPPMPDFPGLTAGIRNSGNSESRAVPYNASGNVFGSALSQEETPASDIKVIAYPDTNSLLIKGTTEQVLFVEKLIAALDVAKRHVELSLWIIDMKKEDLDQLGVDWSGSIAIGNKLGVSFNQATTAGSVSMLDGARFIASVAALAQRERANVVSRPIVLTQENVPAQFDNSRTFYAKLVGERTASLEHVTYGTLISVLPRFSADDQIEMELNIEDGSEAATNQLDRSRTADSLPEVGRTRISTVARVPQGRSLLIGGYTRDANLDKIAKIPVLGDLPFVGGAFRYRSRNDSNTVRLFLIQPREIAGTLTPDASDLAATLTGGDRVNDETLQQKVRAYIDREDQRGN